MKKSDKLDNDFDLLDRLLYDEIGDFKGSSITARMTGRGPLSLQQERLWFLHELTSGAAAYNICSVFRLCGELNISALRDAFRATVERHAALRTAIHNRDGRIEQVFESIYTPLAECLDWTWRGEGEVDKRALQQLLQNEATNPFDLASGQPFRVILVKLDEHHHVLALSMHHIISDAWSLAILMREVAELYAAFTHGHEAALRSLPINYLDYVAWQRENLSEREARELAYWRKELADLPLLDLPTDLPRPSIQTFNGATLSLQVPAHTVRGLQALAADERTTLFCVLMAALQVLLGRHARQQDVAIGTSVAGRELPETEGMVGFFTNMVVIRGRLEEDLSFRTLVRADTVTIRDALDHATLAYNRLVEGLKVLSDYSRNPLFQVAFTLLNAPVAPPPLGTLKAERLLSQEAARFDLELFLHEVDGALSGVFTFNTDLFVKASVDRLIEQWLVLLADAAASPDKPVSHLAMMHNTLSLLTVPIKTSEPFLPVHEAFLAHAQRQPEAVALWLGEQSLSYGELETQARSITHRLIEAGVRADQSVGLWFEPGFSMIAAMLGTLMAGGGYVPLQPGYPVEHIAYILKDSGVDIVVSDANLAWPVLNFDGRVLLMGQTDAPGPCTLPETQPGHLAYIIYTSGSTGRPKGVEISHTNVARLFSSCDHLFDFDSKDVWTFFHSYAFDFSVWEIWGALVHGASLVIVPPELARTPDVFYELLCECKVTVLSQTPSAFRQLMAAEEAQPREADLALRYLVFGGEALNIGGLAPWMDRHGDDAPVLVNMYGITETTVHVTLRRIAYADLRGPASSVIIGTPLPDLCIRLLDPYGKPVPPGMTGEIYVGGAGVARGYRRQPELTAQRFFKDAAGLRLYRSGDLARINAWGELEYRGRTDTQVKLRGYRIEIGEIESALKSHAAIADAVVVVQGLLEAARLVAYVRLHRETVGDSRGAVKDWLPSFDMIYAEAEAEDDELDIVGWNDSYDNQPLPAEHIRLWRDETLARLRGLQPTRVLELGTGSGMLLLRLAGSVECYHGLDFSTRAVARLTKKVAARGYQQVRLEHREASDQAGLSGDFDLVVLNSTAQYFPSAAYFLDVLEQAMQRLQPGGHLFVGDLRHLGLLRNFHASRLLHRRPEGSTRTSLRELLAKLCASEKELLVDPDFFFHWAAVRGDIAGIKILPKERGGLNELTAYRYDAVIVTGTPTSPSPYKLVDADGPEPTWEGRPLMVRGVPNARLGATDAFLSWLDADGETFATPTVQDWDAWSQVKREPDPAALVAAWRAQAGVAVLYWATGDNSGSFDLAVAASNSELPRIGIPTETTVEFGRFFNTPSKSIDRPALAPMLHQHLSTRLPGYMLPAAYVVLETFPLTVNGKLNVKTLPAPGEAAETAPGEQFAIWSATERKIGEIWKEVLQLQHLDLHANFFECGGHSLLATQVISRLRATFAVELPLRSLFDKPTITEFSAMLDELNPQAAPLPAIVPTTRGDLLPLSFAQQRFWFMEQIDQGQIGSYNVSLGLRLRGKLDRTALRAAITAIIARHEVLRTRFVQREGVPMQQIEPAWTLNMAEIDFSGQPSVEAEAALAALVASQAHARFDLAAAPPVRFALVYMAEREHVLQLSLHHAISDGWSLGVMVREFSEHYTAFLEGRAVRLPELPLQFGDVAVWQRSEMTSTRLESLLARWKRRLQGHRPGWRSLWSRRHTPMLPGWGRSSVSPLTVYRRGV
ncbi:hypothetical protein CCS41_13905 (plasmid) [Candidatus Fukatsuia symbiotica]|uniref:Carrier domain-containing protein n=1 Tax=Candidatus Fukatsuia symbiotica TaxID=1878942 RepID=A0A2Y9CKH4_9GAMM|nr:non-ribosomal peptide synthetase [Candidatus Fukatsuia symbiotica]AWK15520.1 hypothetical protein CCS41_13905 [Candidatus Fukatsuia symbiotica]